MSAKMRSLYTLCLAVTVFCIFPTSSVVIRGQTPSQQPVGVPDDWTHHRVVFSDPGTLSQALVRGKLDEWMRITHDPRYQIQQSKRALAQRGMPALAPDFATLAAQFSAQSQGREPARATTPKQTLKKDWSMEMGGAASQTGTVATNNATGSSSVIVDGVTLTASAPTAASATGTFTGAPTAGQTVRITNGSDVATLTAVASSGGTGTITVTGRPSSFSTLTIGAQVYTFASACGGTAFCINRPGGFPTPSNAQYASNIDAAIMGNSSLCGTTSPCFGTGTTANASATATVAAAVVTLTNTTSSAITFSTTQGVLTLSPTGGTLAAPTGANACTGAAPTFTGTFRLNSNTTTQAANLAAAITACPTAVGVSATSATNIVTVTARAAGTGGNSIDLAEGLANFTWSGGVLTGGADGAESGTTWAYWSVNAAASTAQVAANIAFTINANATLQAVSTGVSATSSGNVVTVTARTAGTAGNSYGTSVTAFSGFTWGAADLAGGATAALNPAVAPAKYSFTTSTANCDSAATPDFVVYNTGLAGSATQPSIIAYYNLYSGCSTSSVPVPNIYWQYNTGGTAPTAVVLSYDGTQVAFVQTEGATAYLVILKWAAGSTLATLANTAAGSYRACTAPCMTTLAFNGSHNDTGSAPFYDYNNDVIYVGDNSGYLHQFAHIFLSGTPAETTSGGFPAQFSSTNALTGPVLDSVSGNVYAGPTGAGSGGNFHRCQLPAPPAAPTTCTVVSVTALADTAGEGFGDGVLVDSSAKKVYAFVAATSNGANAAVYQLPVAFAAAAWNAGGEGVTQQLLGEGSATSISYTGTFDNIYYTSGNAASPTGNLYVCGRAASSLTPTLYRVPIASNVLGTPVIGPALATGTTNCSPLAEFYNGTADYIFVSVQADNVTAAPISCPAGAGCLMSFTVTSTTGWGTGKATASTALQTGGTGAMVIDNNVTSPSGSQVYFSPLGSQACTGNSAGTAGIGTGPCAIQASQANVAD